MRLFTPQSASGVHDQANNDSTDKNLTPIVTTNEIDKIGFIGLGAMGLGMATSLVKAGFRVSGYDVSPRLVTDFVAVGRKAEAAISPEDAATDATVFILMVQNAAQIEDVLFGSGKAADRLSNGCVVIINSTVPPSFVRNLRISLLDLGREIELVDAPVSGGVTKAANGQLTVSSRDALSSRMFSDQDLLDYLLCQWCCYVESKSGPCCYEWNPEKSLSRRRRRRCGVFDQTYQSITRWDPYRRGSRSYGIWCQVGFRYTESI